MFQYINNACIIWVSKLLARIKEFGIIYNLAKIYSNFEVSKPENIDPKPKSNVELNAKSNIEPKTSLHTILWTSSVNNFRFHFVEIYKFYIKSKQTYIVRQ